MNTLNIGRRNGHVHQTVQVEVVTAKERYWAPNSEIVVKDPKGMLHLAKVQRYVGRNGTAKECPQANTYKCLIWDSGICGWGEVVYVRPQNILGYASY